MTSLHRLIAIAIVWLITGFLGALVPGVALLRFLDAAPIVMIYAALAVAAAFATWVIARNKSS